jgi:hypothetical protein
VGQGTGSVGSRRDFLRKVALYGPPTVLAGRYLLVDAGAAFGAPTSSTSLSGSVTGSTSTTSIVCVNSVISSSLAGGGSYPGEAPLDILNGDLRQLEAFLNAGNPGPYQGDVQRAVDALTRATDSSNWTDTSTLAAHRGEVVFNSVAQASDALRRVTANDVCGLAFLQRDFVAALSSLASSAVQAALVEASTDVASGDADGAIDLLTSLWRAASKDT